ncbi:hypothetical protein BOX15_Mlig000637g3 [Macrostomum lignano]|uniref:RRM domain-containing protein n=1 Tax=Macrostomum lignano TaxID=282301 RepID=A0A267EE94_9PLAT|nr:hypothetical protein BOX15_Mlig000637g3 [Macrostomum lignano]
MLADSNNNKKADESDSTQAQPAPTVDSNSNSSSDSEQLLLLSDFVLLPPDIPDAKSSKAVAADANHRQYVRYSASLGDRTVLLFDAVPTDQWPAVLHQLGPGACPLYFSIGDNQQQPAEALSDVSLMLAEWNDPDAMRLGEDCWPADQLVDFAPLPAPTQLTDAPADAMSDEAAVEAPATALALLKPGTDRAKLTSRLANAGARTHNLWPVPVSAALRLDSRLNGQRRRRPLDDNIGDANDEAFAPDPVGEAESESKRPRLSIDANQPLWQVQPGKQAYLRITGLRRSADPVQLTDLTMHQLAGLALTGYSFYPPGPADCGKAVLCTFKPDVPVSSIESAADDLVRMFERQGLQDSERRPVTASVVLPDSVGASSPANRMPDSFGDSFVLLQKETAADPVFLLIWNLPSDLSANLIVHRMRRFLPMARSFYCPRPVPASSGQLRNCGFAVARFNRPADCAHAMERMRSATQQQLMAIFCSGLIRVSYAALLETCHVPPMFTFPCHNLLPWLINANQNSENPLDFLLDSPPYSPAPFTCPCHPDAMPSAPAGGMFDWLAFTLRMRLPADGDPIQTVRLLSDLMLESEELVPIHVTAAWLSSASSAKTSAWAAATSRLHPVNRHGNAALLLALNNGEVDDANNNSSSSRTSSCSRTEEDATTFDRSAEQWRLLPPSRPLRCWQLTGLPTEADRTELAVAIRRAFPSRVADNLYIAGHASLNCQLAVLRLPVSMSAKVAESAASRLSKELPGQSELRLRQWCGKPTRLADLRPTLAPFCPVPDGCATRCQFILAWNLHRQLATAEVAARFLDRFPLIRSVFAPTAPASLANGANNLGYCVLRFDRPRDCARALAALRSLSAADLANLCCPAGPAYFTLCEWTTSAACRRFSSPVTICCLGTAAASPSTPAPSAWSPGSGPSAASATRTRPHIRRHL